MPHMNVFLSKAFEKGPTGRTAPNAPNENMSIVGLSIKYELSLITILKLLLTLYGAYKPKT